MRLYLLAAAFAPAHGRLALVGKKDPAAVQQESGDALQELEQEFSQGQVGAPALPGAPLEGLSQDGSNFLAEAADGAYREKFQAAQKQVDDMSKLLRLYRASATSSVKDTSQQLSGMRSQEESAVESLKNQVQQEHLARVTAEHKLQDVTATLGENQEEADAMRSQLLRSSAAFKMNQMQAAAQLSGAQSALAQAGAALQKQAAEVYILRSRAAAAEAEVERLQQLLTAANAKREQSDSAETEENRELRDLRAKLKVAEQQMLDAGVAHEQAKEQLRASQSQSARLQNMVDSLQQDLAQTEQQLQQKQAQAEAVAANQDATMKQEEQEDEHLQQLIVLAKHQIVSEAKQLKETSSTLQVEEKKEQGAEKRAKKAEAEAQAEHDHVLAQSEKIKSLQQQLTTANEEAQKSHHAAELYHTEAEQHKQQQAKIESQAKANATKVAQELEKQKVADEKASQELKAELGKSKTRIQELEKKIQAASEEKIKAAADEKAKAAAAQAKKVQDEGLTAEQQRQMDQARQAAIAEGQRRMGGGDSAPAPDTSAPVAADASSGGDDYETVSVSHPHQVEHPIQGAAPVGGNFAGSPPPASQGGADDYETVSTGSANRGAGEQFESAPSSTPVQEAAPVAPVSTGGNEVNEPAGMTQEEAERRAEAEAEKNAEQNRGAEMEAARMAAMKAGEQQAAASGMMAGLAQERSAVFRGAATGLAQQTAQADAADAASTMSDLERQERILLKMEKQGFRAAQ
mmetsp:Transcript_30654/g.65059  ORF Transcript_30654/g.65059 Transcript_30654/m.65059 type:complete len:746 (+) Transcript_30654:91-2328(+)